MTTDDPIEDILRGVASRVEDFLQSPSPGTWEQALIYLREAIQSRERKAFEAGNHLSDCEGTMGELWKGYQESEAYKK